MQTGSVPSSFEGAQKFLGSFVDGNEFDVAKAHKIVERIPFLHSAVAWQKAQAAANP